MLNFQQNITLVQFLIPPICSGILLGGLLIYLYMYIRVRTNIYLAIVLLTMCSLGFASSETMILSIGGWLHHRPWGNFFHRLEQISGAFFLFSLPFFLDYLLRLSRTWHRINRVIAVFGLVSAVAMTALALALPDTFISPTINKATWLKYEADYARGQEGIAYQVRDLLLGMYIVYSLVSIVVDIRKNKNFRELIFPVAGLALAWGGAIIDTLFVYTGTNFDFFPHEYFSRFTLGITLMTILFMSTVTKRFIDATKEVERAHAVISLSEERYRRLVEGTNDCIFSMDEDLNILSSNTSARAQLHLEKNEQGKTNFYDLLHGDPDELELTRQLVQDKILTFFETRKPVTFKAMLKTHGTKEPKEYRVLLESIDTGERTEILLKAMGFSDDTLMKYIDSEKMRFTIGNYLTAADEISKRLILNLPKYMAPKEIVNLRIGLREIIFNAIEHGNLNISFEEKTEATMTSDYIQFIHERQKDDRYRNKKVCIEFSLTPERVQYKVTDEGSGFDYRAMIDYLRNSTGTSNLAHGRGLNMAFNIFDEVLFNKKGNQVLLTKHFQNPENA